MGDFIGDKGCSTHHLGCECHEASRNAEINRLRAEVSRLMRVIARELSENDELGTEFTYVMALKEQAMKYRVALRDIKQGCEWYTDKGTDQERHHFVAVETVHRIEQALEENPDGSET